MHVPPRTRGEKGRQTPQSKLSIPPPPNACVLSAGEIYCYPVWSLVTLEGVSPDTYLPAGGGAYCSDPLGRPCKMGTGQENKKQFLAHDGDSAATNARCGMILALRRTPMIPCVSHPNKECRVSPVLDAADTHKTHTD